MFLGERRICLEELRVQTPEEEDGGASEPVGGAVPKGVTESVENLTSFSGAPP